MAIPPQGKKKRTFPKTKKGIIRLFIIRTIANFLILFTVFGIILTFAPALYYEVSYRILKLKGYEFVLSDNALDSELNKILDHQKALASGSAEKSEAPPDISFLEAILSDGTRAQITPKSVDFGIVIPKIGANEEVVLNVDPENQDQYNEVLKHSVAHARGSSLPGLGGSTYLFAHSATTFWDVGRHNALFYLIKDLENGDDIVVFFDKKRHNYKVVDKQTIDAEDTHFLTTDRGEGEELLLQTCWPPGTTLKRLVVIAKPVAN